MGLERAGGRGGGGSCTYGLLQRTSGGNLQQLLKHLHRWGVNTLKHRLNFGVKTSVKTVLKH